MLTLFAMFKLNLRQTHYVKNNKLLNEKQEACDKLWGDDVHVVFELSNRGTVASELSTIPSRLPEVRDTKVTSRNWNTPPAINKNSIRPRPQDTRGVTRNVKAIRLRQYVPQYWWHSRLVSYPTYRPFPLLLYKWKKRNTIQMHNSLSTVILRIV